MTYLGTEFLLLVYLGLRNVLFYKLLKVKESQNLVISTTILVISLGIDKILSGIYISGQSFYTIKNAIILPPFALIYFLADLVTTVVIVLLYKILNLPNKAVLILDFGRLIFLFLSFYYIIMDMQNTSIKQTGFNIARQSFCQEQEILYDFATFYEASNKFPTSLDEFTSYKESEITRLPLVLKYVQNPLEMEVVDTAGNIVVSKQHFDMYSKDAAFYKHSLEKALTEFCK